MPITSAPAEICTKVMEVLKQEGVSDIEAPLTVLEGLCSRFYEDKKRALLRKHPWNFARTRTTLIADTATPEDFAYQYALPNDYIRFLWVGTSYKDQITDYELEGRKILSDYGGGSVRFCYIYDVTNVVHFDPLFLSALVYDLAVDCSCALVGIKTGVLNNLKGLRNEAMQEARSINGQENRPKVIDISAIETARRRGSGTSGYNKVGY